MAQILLVINEQHQVMDDQTRALDERFGKGSWERLNVPSEGWTTVEQVAKVEEVADATLVFASPIPAMMLEAVRRESGATHALVNDRREKKEFQQKDGSTKIVFVVAPTGWEVF